MEQMLSCSIIDKIKTTEASIKTCYDKVKELEVRILNEDLSEEIKKTAEDELHQVKRVLADNEEQLSKLHVQNMRSFAIIAIVIFGAFLIYGVYAMFYMNF